MRNYIWGLENINNNELIKQSYLTNFRGIILYQFHFVTGYKQIRNKHTLIPGIIQAQQIWQ